MSNENRQQQVDQLLRGIYRMCVNRDACEGCPYYNTKCMFEEPKPSTWFDEESIEIPAAPEAEEPKEEVAAAAPAVAAEEPEETAEEAAEESTEKVAEEAPEKPAEEKQEEKKEENKEDDDSVGTWLVSTTMGSVFTKYVFICSKCGYRKESVFSITPMTYCPECEKRRAGRT